MSVTIAECTLSTAAQEFGARMARVMTAGGAAERDSAERELALVAALALERSEQGHAFLDFEAPVLLPRAPTDGVRAGADAVAFTGHVGVRGAIEKLGIVRAQPAPGELLVLDGAHLYLRSMWEDEVWLAAWLRERRTAAKIAPPGWVDELVAASFPADSPAEQRAAVRACAAAPFAVLTGGPGTGKTFTAARVVLAQAVAHALRAGRAPVIALLAPTGKAARRVDASVAAAVQTMAAPVQKLRGAWSTKDASRALEHAWSAISALRGHASTIHAALESDPRGAKLFRRTSAHPLAADIVLVDEASMVSLGIMRALCEAIRPDAQLVLLGDPQQLQSVEAGSVLADLAGEGTGPEQCVHVLRVSRRFPEDGGIGRLALAIRHGERNDAGELSALALLEADADVRAQVSVTEPEPARTTAHAVALAVQHLAPLHDSQRTPQEKLQTLESFALLCARRSGPGGADEINAALVKRWGPLSARGGRPYDGMPVIVLRNSRDTGLSNGDVGVVCADRAGELIAHFDGGRKIHADMLPEHAPAYALTVHKSQGSEYDRVALVLPERESPVLTRELVYTALTRWRATPTGGVTIIGTQRVLKHALESRVQRASGLPQRLARS